MNQQRQTAFKRLLSYQDQALRWINPVFDNREQRAWLNRYREFLVKTYGNADFAGVADANQQVPMALADIFVEEQFAEHDLSPDEGAEDFHERLENAAPADIEDLLIRFNADDAPQSVSGRAVVIGAPGSGKSSLVRVLAVACAQARRSRFNQHFGRRLVIPFILRELDLTGVDTVTDLLERWAARVAAQSGQADLIDLDYVRFYLQQGWALVAFDGVDEIGLRYRRRLWRLVYAFAAVYPQVAVLVTGRPTGFERLTFQSPKPRLWRAILSREQLPDTTRCPVSFGYRHLCPFTDTQVDTYAQRWYQARYPADHSRQQRERQSLLDNLQQQRALARLKRRPIYLATLTYVHDVKGRLPNSQVRAYGMMVEAYLDVLDAVRRLQEDIGVPVMADFDFKDKLQILERLARDLHEKRIGEAGTEGETPFHLRLRTEEFKTWLHEWLVQEDCPLALTRYFAGCQDEAARDVQVQHLLDYFIARSGLLVQPEDNVLMFSHLSFQEYLTGSWIFRELGNHLFDAPDFLQQTLLRHLSADTAWHPVGLVFFSLQTQHQGGRFQEDLLKSTWLQEEKPNPYQLLFLHRLQAEGEPTFSAAFKWNLWLFYWKAAIKQFSEEWFDTFNILSRRLMVWGELLEGTLHKRFDALQGEADARELTLYSVLPKEWLSKWWRLSPDIFVARWGHPTAGSASAWALDVHTTHPPVCNFLAETLGLELILSAGETGWRLMPLYRIHQDTETRTLYDNMLAADVVCFMKLACSPKKILNRARIRLQALDRSGVMIRTLEQVKVLDYSPDLHQARRLAQVRVQAWGADLQSALVSFSAPDKVLNKVLYLIRVQLLYRKWNDALSVTRISCWLIINTTAALTPKFYPTAAQAIQALEALGVQHPEFRALFAKDWFPYRDLKKIPPEQDMAEPIEAVSHRLYRYLRHHLAKAGKNISDLPAYLELQPGQAMRHWHGDAVADNYLRALRAAGWDPANWPPADVDLWINQEKI